MPAIAVPAKNQASEFPVIAMTVVERPIIEIAAVG
jgi:hypothetical protein